MAQVDNHCPFIKEVRFTYCDSPCDFCGEQSRTEKFFSPSTSVASYKYHPHTNLNRSATLIERKFLRNLGNYTQSNALSDIGKHWAETYFHIVYALGG